MQLFFNRACTEHRKLFRETFGGSAEVNIENMRKAVAAGLSVYHYIYHCMKRGSAKQEELEILYLQVLRERDAKSSAELKRLEREAFRNHT
jgi:hypothetical protein